MKVEEVEKQAPDRSPQPSEDPEPEEPSQPGTGEPDPAEQPPTPDRPPGPDPAATNGVPSTGVISEPVPIGPRPVHVRVTRLPAEDGVAGAQ